MFEMLFNVCCASGPKMMIWANGVFALVGGSTFMEFIDCMDVLLGAIRACVAQGGASDT
jgi:hypothetical protein